jgi:hypothetical protein
MNSLPTIAAKTALMQIPPSVTPTRGESVNAAWLMIAAICVCFISYRRYALFVADKVLGVDTNR